MWEPEEIDKVRELLRRMIGTPYAMGYQGEKDWVVRGKPHIDDKDPKEFDCSGLSRWIIAQGICRNGLRIVLPHGTIEQLKACIPIARPPRALDLGFADMDGSGQPDHVIIAYSSQIAIEARGKPFNKVIERPISKWESWPKFLGWWAVGGVHQ